MHEHKVQQKITKRSETQRNNTHYSLFPHKPSHVRVFASNASLVLGILSKEVLYSIRMSLFSTTMLANRFCRCSANIEELEQLEACQGIVICAHCLRSFPREYSISHYHKLGVDDRTSRKGLGKRTEHDEQKMKYR
jgi:hypothetical protein